MATNFLVQARRYPTGEFENLILTVTDDGFRLTVEESDGSYPSNPDSIAPATPVTVNHALDTAALPAGVILLWSGSVGSIPTGWALCDGTNGTPDLRDRFVIGAAGGLSPNDVGGAASENYTPEGTVSQPTFAGNQVNFTTDLFVSLAGVTAALVSPSSITPAGTVSQPTFAGQAAMIDTLPPFYALCYIMRL